MEHLATITNNLVLEQSEMFSDVYKRAQKMETQTFNDVSINSIDEWYNSILTKYDFSERIQVECLHSFFYDLKKLLSTIDPKKLNIQDDLIENTDLLLWRESSLGISKLIFDEFGQIVYMFNGNNGKKVKGIFDFSVDMEKLLYRFISM